MNRSEFIRALNEALDGLPQGEARRVAEYYEELFNEALDEGKSEEEVCAGLGAPEDIAGRVRAELAFIRAEQKPSAKAVNTVLLVLLGIFALPIGIPLGIAALSVLFALFVSVFAIVFSLGAAVLALGVSGLALIAGGVAVIAGGALWFGIALIGAAFVLIGIGMLGCVGVYYLARVMLRGVVKVSRTVYGKVADRVKRGGNVNETGS